MDGGDDHDGVVANADEGESNEVMGLDYATD